MKLVLKFEVSAAVVESRNKFEFFISFAKMEFSLQFFYCHFGALRIIRAFGL